MWKQWRHHASHDGVFERYHDGDDREFYREKVQDVQPILDHNARVRNETDGRTAGGGRKIGSIPAVVFYEWVAEWTRQGLIGPGHMGPLNDLIAARLRDGDWSKLRTTNGGI